VIAGRIDRRTNTVDLVLASRTDPPVPLVTAPGSAATTATVVLLRASLNERDEP